MGGRTPREDGLLMPARWAQHDRTLVQWPTREAFFFAHLPEARHEYSEAIRVIARFEPVTVIANPGAKRQVVEMCGTDKVDVIEIPIDDAWVRDNGPIFVTDGRSGVAMTHFGFNAWGGKTDHYSNDADMARHLAEHLRMRRYVAPLIVEGGGITVDGEGTMITTETVSLNPNRNPGMTRDEVEAVFRAYLGVEKIIWIPHGLAEDSGERGTDGHSDNVVQFIRPGLVLLQTAPDRGNPNWDLSAENRARLASGRDAMGRKLEIVEMPYLSYSTKVDAQPYAAPYTNFYPVNGGLVAPSLGAADEDKAFAILQDLFPDREIVGTPADLQAYGGGGIGCITQQIPSGTPLPPGQA